MRLVIARCSVDYVGRLTAHLPSALRLLIVKADGSVLVHSDGGSYKPLNWMSPPCRLTEEPGKWTVTGKAGETLAITITEVLSDTSADLGVDPGLVKDGVEAHLQELLAVQLDLLGEGWRLVRREYPTPIGPVDLMCRNEAGAERRRGDQAARSRSTAWSSSPGTWTLLNRDPLLAPVHGVFAAQEIKPAGPHPGHRPGHPLRHAGLRAHAWRATGEHPVLTASAAHTGEWRSSGEVTRPIRPGGR